MIAQENHTGYTDPAPEKDGAGFGDLLLCGGQPPSVRFFNVRMSPSMGGACGASSDAPIVPHNRFANPQALARPVWRQERQGYKPYVRRHIMYNQSIATSVATESFNFDNFPVRAINRNGDIWFIAADVCAAIDIGTEKIRRLDDDEKGLHLTQTPGGKQEMSIINESGLYALILRSRKPEAKRFRKWVTSEVLPAIRKTGKYAVNSLPPWDDEKVLQNPSRLTTEKLMHMLSGRRILLNFSHYGDVKIDLIPHKGFFTTHDEIPSMIRKFPDFMFPEEDVLQIAKACVERLEVERNSRKKSRDETLNRSRGAK